LDREHIVVEQQWIDSWNSSVYPFLNQEIPLRGFPGSLIVMP
jgi:hypothetical protein